MGSWRQVRVEVDAGEVDLVCGAVWSAGAAGVEERPSPSGARCTLLVSVPVDRLASVVEALAGRELVVEEVDPEVGLDTWKRYACPVEAGGFLVEPAWAPCVATGPAGSVASGREVGGPYRIVLDPGRSFGSGSHVTTQLMLEAVGRFVAPGCRVLDVGCGSGVLSVAAAIAGAAEVRAVDIDLHAVQVTITNARRNGVAAQVVCDAEPVDRVAGVYDLVLANIGAGVLVGIAPSLASKVAPGGRLVLSGLLDEQADQVAAAYARVALRALERRSRDGWTLLVLAPTSGATGTVPRAEGR
ncbi:MAG: 50S ribosomal protein L11 methyltransferase [Acidimicrobiales bacterium]